MPIDNPYNFELMKMIQQILDKLWSFRNTENFILIISDDPGFLAKSKSYP